MGRRAWIAAAAVTAVLGVGAIAAFQAFKIYIPGVVGRLKHPIQPYHEVTWQAGPSSAPADRPPNIVLIVADDLGYNDVTATGHGVGNVVPTPRIDSIAHEGVTFTNGYAANATCSPSRAAMMTGRYPTRFGFEFTSAPPRFARTIAEMGSGPVKTILYPERFKDVPPTDQLGVPPSEVMVGEVLKQRGYRTLHIGKWHLGEVPELQPNAQGFDESLSILAGAGLYLPTNDPNVVNSKQAFDPIDKFLWANLPYSVRKDGGEPFHPNAYITDYFAGEAVKAIRANRNRPFFLYLAFNAPHTPLQAAKADFDALPQIKDHRLRVYGAMVRGLDRGVGKVLDELKAQGLDENTLVIFTSDNGGANYIGLPDINRPYRGFKATFFEGGVHVPFFMRWPKTLPAGERADLRAMHIDIFPTAAAAGGASTAGLPIDGVDLISLARGQAAERPLFFRSGHYRVVIYQNWKLQLSERPKKTWLFDLAADPTEQTNVASARPDRVAALTALLDEQDRKAGRPLWPALLEGPIYIDHPLGGPIPKDAEYVMWAN